MEMSGNFVLPSLYEPCIGFVTHQEPTAKIIVSKILADLISKFIDKSEKLLKVENRQTDRQKNT